MKLRSLVNSTRAKHLSDFTSLERMRTEVDGLQAAYDNAVERFKREIGVDETALHSLMTQIYNKFQNEILEHDNRRNKK